MSRLTEHLVQDPDSLGKGAKHPVSGLFTVEDRRRFWAKVRRGSASECWPWTGSKLGRDGYGQFGVMTPGGVSRKQLHLYTHRVAWIVTHGEIPPDLCVLHRCDNPICVNPGHLFLGTQLDNMRDAARKGRLSVPRPGRHKVTTAQLAEVDALLRDGVKQCEIAKRYGISKGWISAYARGDRRQYDRPAAVQVQRSA